MLLVLVNFLFRVCWDLGLVFVGCGLNCLWFGFGVCGFDFVFDRFVVVGLWCFGISVLVLVGLLVFWFVNIVSLGGWCLDWWVIWVFVVMFWMFLVCLLLDVLFVSVCLVLFEMFQLIGAFYLGGFVLGCVFG